MVVAFEIFQFIYENCAIPPFLARKILMFHFPLLLWLEVNYQYMYSSKKIAQRPEIVSWVVIYFSSSCDRKLTFGRLDVYFWRCLLCKFHILGFLIHTSLIVCRYGHHLFLFVLQGLFLYYLVYVQLQFAYFNKFYYNGRCRWVNDHN